MREETRARLRRGGEMAWDILRIAAVIALALWLLIQLRLVVIPFLLALFLASLGTPLEGRLERVGIPKLAATWIVTLIGAAVVAGFIWFIVSRIQASIGDISESLQGARDRLESWLAEGPFGLDGQQLQEQFDAVWADLGQNLGMLGSRLVTGIATFTEVVAGFLLMIVVAFFLIKDGEQIWEWVVAKSPEDDQEEVDRAGKTAWATLRRYLAGTAVVGVVNGTGVLITLLVLGVPLAVPLALLMFVGAFFPLVGALVSGTVVTLVTFATNGLTDALIVAGVVIAVQQLEGDVVAPLVLGRAVELHPLVILLAVTAGFAVAGIIGAFLAVPIVGVAAQVTRELEPSTLKSV